MNSKLNKEIVDLIGERKWTDVLRKLPDNEAVPLIFDSVNDMNTFRTIAARMNNAEDATRRFTFSGVSYLTLSLSVTTIAKNNGSATTIND